MLIKLRADGIHIINLRHHPFFIFYPFIILW